MLSSFFIPIKSLWLLWGPGWWKHGWCPGGLYWRRVRTHGPSGGASLLRMKSPETNSSRECSRSIIEMVLISCSIRVRRTLLVYFSTVYFIYILCLCLFLCLYTMEAHIVHIVHISVDQVCDVSRLSGDHNRNNFIKFLYNLRAFVQMWRRNCLIDF